MTIINYWKKTYNYPYPILFADFDGIGKVNLKTKRISINKKMLIASSKEKGIDFQIFLYYTLNHEYGHLECHRLKNTSNEELYAHNYAIEQCKKLFKNTIQLQRLKNLEKELLINLR